MSARSARAMRRALERSHHREALDAVDPSSGGRAAHRVCIAPGCRQHGPSVRYGAVVITICIDHKSDFDRQWSLTFDRGAVAS